MRSSRSASVLAGIIPTMIITASQFRMARGALKWQIRDVAERAEIAVSTLSRFENGKGDPHLATLRKLVAAFEAEGIEFIEDGVRYRAND